MHPRQKCADIPLGKLTSIGFVKSRLQFARQVLSGIDAKEVEYDVSLQKYERFALHDTSVGIECLLLFGSQLGSFLCIAHSIV